MKQSDRDEILILDPKIFPNESLFTKNDFHFYFDPKFSFVSYNESDNKINGYVIAKKNSRSIFMGNGGVEKQYEGCGIGKALMASVIHAAEHSKDINNLRLRVRISNQRAIGLYTKYGFTPDKSNTDSTWQYMQKPIKSKLHTPPPPAPAPFKENPDTPAEDIKNQPGVSTEDSSAPGSQSSDASFHEKPRPFSSEHDLRKERLDVLAVQDEISRLRKNAKSFFSINNNTKANKIEAALNQALAEKVADVRTDNTVQASLSRHRIFGFFGCKTTKAIENIKDSITQQAAP